MSLTKAGAGYEHAMMPNIPAMKWNPIRGCKNLPYNPCSNPDGEPYCYLYHIWNRLKKNENVIPFKTFLDRKKMTEILKRKKPSIIVCGTCGDMFNPEAKDDWLQEIVEEIYLSSTSRLYPPHFFLFLTKWPERYKKLSGGILGSLANVGWGASVTKAEDLWRRDVITGLDVKGMKYINLEPLYYRGEFNINFLKGIDWAVFGPETQAGLPVYDIPERTIHSLVSAATFTGTALFTKSSVINWEKIVQFPEKMKTWANYWRRLMK